MDPNDLKRLEDRLAKLGGSDQPSVTDLVRDLFDSIHAARIRGVSNRQVADELGQVPAILNKAYLRECSRRGVEPVRTRTKI